MPPRGDLGSGSLVVNNVSHTAGVMFTNTATILDITEANPTFIGPELACFSCIVCYVLFLSFSTLKKAVSSPVRLIGASASLVSA
jgi:hypothetical protein